MPHQQFLQVLEILSLKNLMQLLAQAVMSVGAVKAVEIGDGTEVAHMNGSEDNDGFHFKNGHNSQNYQSRRWHYGRYQ